MRRLYKSSTDKVLDGVCGGIAQHFGVDSVLVRIIWILVSIFMLQGIFGVLLYLIAMMIIPREPSGINSPSAQEFNNPDNYTSNYQLKEPGNKKRSAAFYSGLGVLLIITGLFFLLDHLFDLRLRNWAYYVRPYFWPVLMILLGLILLVRRKK